jgi:branched-chain amino acid transport system permease protein
VSTMPTPRPQPDPRLVGVAIAVVVVLALVPFVASTYVVTVVLRMVVLGLFALAFNVVFGMADMPSLGHAALFGVGSYAAGAVLGLVMGVATLRTQGIYLLLLTLAIAQAVWGLAFQQVRLTGGDNGIAGIDRTVLTLGGDGLVGFYWAAVAVVAVAAGLLYAFRISIVGTVVEALAMSPSRLRALGFAVGGYRVTAFVVSGAFSALAGMLMALATRFVGPENLAWQLSAEVMLFAILGGAASFAGPLVGVMVVTGAEVVVSDWTERWPLVLGLLYVVTLLFLPDGIVGWLSRWRDGRDAGGPPRRRGVARAVAEAE